MFRGLEVYGFRMKASHRPASRKTSCWGSPQHAPEEGLEKSDYQDPSAGDIGSDRLGGPPTQ